MFLSINTVKAYNKSLYRKLGVTSRQDAVAAARALGLI
jgi:LuxR family maltose regulon positive regulatory protein